MTRIAALLLVYFVCFIDRTSLVAGADEPTPLQRYEASASIMGSTYTIAALGENRGNLASAVRAAFDEARRIDDFLSNYKPNSELSRINRDAAGGPVIVSQEMADLLSRCFEYSRASEGAFDISVGALMKVWGFHRGSGALPDAWQLAAARSKVGFQNIELDRRNSTVLFLKNGIELDPGGIGKGYAVDRMADILGKAGVSAAFISAAGSSMYAIGAPPDRPDGWPVRIRNPENPAATLEEIHLRDQSLSTSGTYEKFFEADGQIYSHIMDPRTGMPARGVVSVSVLAPSTLDSEAWTKAFFVNGRDWSVKNSPEGYRVFLCQESRPCGWLP